MWHPLEEEEEEVMLSEVQGEFFQIEIHWKQCYRPSQFQLIINPILHSRAHFNNFFCNFKSYSTMQKMKLFCPKIQDDCQLQMVTIVVVFKG